MAASELNTAERDLSVEIDKMNASPQWKSMEFQTPPWNNWFHETIRKNKDVMHDIRAYWSDQQKVMKILFILGDYARGSPFHAHGGLTYTLMDTIGGWALLLGCESHGLTKSAEIEYKAPIFPFRMYSLETSILNEVKGKLGVVGVNILDVNGKVCMKGTFDYRFGKNVPKWSWKTGKL